MESVNHTPTTPEKVGEVINELLRGLDSARHLELLVQDRSGSNAQILTKQIKGCFSTAMTRLNSSNHANEFVNQLRLDPVRQSRSRLESLSQEKVILENPDDGYAWRNYSQKDIHSSKYPRFYFECTHKEDRNCSATRTVQRLEEDASMYEIIYCGQHTCMQLPNKPDFENSNI